MRIVGREVLSPLRDRFALLAARDRRLDAFREKWGTATSFEKRSKSGRNPDFGQL